MHRLHLLGFALGLVLGIYCIDVGLKQGRLTPVNPVPTAYAP